MHELQRITTGNPSADVVNLRGDMARSPRYWFSIATSSYFGAAVVGESIKYVALRLAVWRARPRYEIEYLVYGAMAGLGYGTIETILVAYASIQKGEVVGMVALTLSERTVFASLAHTIVALLTALRSIRQDARGEELAIWQVLAPAVSYHGSWNFVLFCVSAWSGNVGWIHPTDVGSVVFALLSDLALLDKAAWDVSKQFTAFASEDLPVK